MQVRADQLEAHLQRGLRPLYTLHGDEPLQLQEAADAVRAAARGAGFGERQVHTVTGAHFDWSRLLGAAQSMSLFSDRQLVEIRIPSGKPGKDGGEALQRHCAAGSDDLLTLVLLPQLDRQQQASAWFTALDAAGVTVRIDPIDRPALPAWLARRLNRQGQRVADGEEGERTLAFVADRVEGNLLAAHQELQKLALLHPPGVLGFDAVAEAVLDVARFDPARLGEAALAGRVDRVMRVLDGLRAEGESPVRVAWLLGEDIRALHGVRQATDHGAPLPMALRQWRVWGPSERLVERALSRLSTARLARLLDGAHRCDAIAKGLPQAGWPGDPWLALARLAMMVAEPVASAGH
jgi:DNA polymerase-3 subunit delta